MRIAVWNTAFLGDSVLTLPLIGVLSAAWPDAETDFYVRGGLGTLYEAQPGISAVYECRKRGADRGAAAVLRQGREIASRNYDIWVDAHLSLRSSIMARMSAAPVRVGYEEAVFSRFVFTRRISRRFGTMQEIERLLRLAEAAGVPSRILERKETHIPHLVLPEKAYEEAAGMLSSFRDGGPVIGVHPGSVWPTKRWTPEGFAHVVRRAVDSGVKVVLLAGPDEIDTAAEVRTLSGKAAESSLFLDLSGKTSLLSLGAVLAGLDGYVTNDSGPMHMAWAQGTPVTAVFGPTVESLGFAPRGETSSVIQIELPCRPCGLHGHAKCPERHFSCMRNIDPESVWLDVESKLSRRGR